MNFTEQSFNRWKTRVVIALLSVGCLGAVTRAAEAEDTYPDMVSRGVAWNIKGEYDKAIADLSQAIRLNPKYLDAYYNVSVRRSAS